MLVSVKTYLTVSVQYLVACVISVIESFLSYLSEKLLEAVENNLIEEVARYDLL